MNFPVIDPTQWAEAIDAKLAERKLADFVRASWPVLHPTEPFADGWHIDAVSEHLQAVITGQISNLLINIAPRMTKSVMASIDLPAWTWGPLNQPEMTFMYVSFSLNLASDHSVKCRRLIESNWFKRHWGDRFYLTSDQNEKLKFENNHHGVRAAFGMGGVAGQGGRVVVVDDPHDTKDWVSPVRMKHTIETYDGSVHNRVNVPSDPRRIVIAQRIATSDLSGHLLQTKEWEYLMLPTEYDPARSRVTSLGWKDPRKKRGELLNKGRYGAAQVESERRRPRIYNAQHQQNPTEDTSAIFPRNRWKFYTEPPRAIIGRMEVVIQSWDLTTGGEEPGSSKNAGHVWGKIGAYKFLLDRVLEYMSAGEILKAIRDMTHAWPKATAKVIENKAAGPSTISLLKKEIGGIISWPPQGERQESKIARAWAIQHEHESHNLCLPTPENCPWVEEFIEHCAAFPEGEFDDDVDAMTQAISKLNRIPGTAETPEGVGRSLGWLQ